MRAILIACAVLLIPGIALTQDARRFRLAVAPELERSGLVQYILPRFSLKTQRHAEIVSDAPDAVFGAGQGRPVTRRGGTTFGIALTGENDAARRFADWLLSDIGRKTITAFEPSEGEPFTAPERKTEVAEVEFDGDPDLGKDVAEAHCTRCHRVAEEDRSTIGSTLSFMGLRAMPDWAQRFMAFYTLNPHPSFVRVEGVSPPFLPNRPPTIAPVVLTLGEVEALLAYVATIPPADLGAQIQHQ
ncbi:Cytochrome c [Salinihabitans flavidus]|uniref:Cytochrome c n=2 Tax=Salinihabitans flavidus TaxID=569882 RepID=A0A1H8PS69_9RHOB|nr:Cytochrome c [Salinihabitans flavidus]